MNTRRADLAAPLTQARRIVVKVGSALLVDGETGVSTAPGSRL